MKKILNIIMICLMFVILFSCALSTNNNNSNSNNNNNNNINQNENNNNDQFYGLLNTFTYLPSKNEILGYDLNDNTVEKAKIKKVKTNYDKSYENLGLLVGEIDNEDYYRESVLDTHLAEICYPLDEILDILDQIIYIKLPQFLVLELDKTYLLDTSEDGSYFNFATLSYDEEKEEAKVDEIVGQNTGEYRYSGHNIMTATKIDGNIHLMYLENSVSFDTFTGSLKKTVRKKMIEYDVNNNNLLYNYYIETYQDFIDIIKWDDEVGVTHEEQKVETVVSIHGTAIAVNSFGDINYRTDYKTYLEGKEEDAVYVTANYNTFLLKDDKYCYILECNKEKCETLEDLTLNDIYDNRGKMIFNGYIGGYNLDFVTGYDDIFYLYVPEDEYNKIIVDLPIIIDDVFYGMGSIKNEAIYDYVNPYLPKYNFLTCDDIFASVCYEGTFRTNNGKEALIPWLTISNGDEEESAEKYFIPNLVELEQPINELEQILNKYNLKCNIDSPKTLYDNLINRVNLMEFNKYSYSIIDYIDSKIGTLEYTFDDVKALRDNEVERHNTLDILKDIYKDVSTSVTGDIVIKENGDFDFSNIEITFDNQISAQEEFNCKFIVYLGVETYSKYGDNIYETTFCLYKLAVMVVPKGNHIFKIDTTLNISDLLLLDGEYFFRILVNNPTFICSDDKINVSGPTEVINDYEYNKQYIIENNKIKVTNLSSKN